MFSQDKRWTKNLSNLHYQMQEGITCPMHTASDSPPTDVDTLLGWESIFTTSEALKTNSWGH